MKRPIHLLAAALLAAAAALAAPGSLRADDSPVVVELFTSQGCSSCPPADALLGQLAAREDVIALALHVDYWDYLGWKDRFAHAAFTKRQRRYARAAGSRTVYTPQMIVGGVDHVVGYKPREVAALIQRHASQPQAMDLRVSAHPDGGLRIRAEGALYGEMVVQLVTYRPEATVDIPRGENAGKRLKHSNIVTGWYELARWDGQTPLDLVTEPRRGTDRAVIIVQKAGPGAIVAAARVD